MHLVGFSIRLYHDARSTEHQICGYILLLYDLKIISFHIGWPTNEQGHPVLLHPYLTRHQRQTRVLERRASSIQSRLQQGAQESKWLQNIYIFFSVGLSLV